MEMLAVMASVSASAARSVSSNRSPASAHAARTSGFCSLTPILRASRVCMSRQKAQWLICDARILMRSPMGGAHRRFRDRRRLRRRVPVRRQPVGALQALRPDRIAYLGSVSKSLSQALRLGWMVLPEVLVDRVMDTAGGQQFYVDAISQLTLADFIASGYYDRHIRRMRARYRKRRDFSSLRWRPSTSDSAEWPRG